LNCSLNVSRDGYEVLTNDNDDDDDDNSGDNNDANIIVDIVM